MLPAYPAEEIDDRTEDGTGILDIDPLERETGRDVRLEISTGSSDGSGPRRDATSASPVRSARSLSIVTVSPLLSRRVEDLGLSPVFCGRNGGNIA